MFLQVYVCPRGGGLPQCMLGDPPARVTPPPLPGRHPPPGPHPRGKLRGIRSRPTPKGEIEGDQIQAHTQGGNSGGSDPGPHPRGKFRGIRSRPTSKGEIQGDQVQANIQGGNSGRLGPTPPPMTTAAGGMHHTGMHSCWT